MEQIIWFFLPMIILLGVVTSYTDIMYGKIRNKWVLAGLLYGITVMALVYIYFEINVIQTSMSLAGSEESFSFFKETLINFGIAIVVGILLWLNHIWSAADAKLFMAFAMLTPVNVFKFGYIRFFPSFVIIMNAFVLILLVTGYQLFRDGRGKALEELKYLFLDPKSIAVSAALIFLVQWVFVLFFSILGVQASVLTLLLILLVVINIFGKVINKLNSKNSLFLVGLVVLRLLLDHSIYSGSYLIKFIIIVILFVIARLFLQNLASRCFSHNVAVDNLKKGMILAKSLVKPAGKNYYTFMNEREKNKTKVDTIVHPSAEGLTIQDLKKIRKAFLENRVKDKSIPIVAHTCFGPYIFAGTMLAILLQGNIIVVAANVLGNI